MNDVRCPLTPPLTTNSSGALLELHPVGVVCCVFIFTHFKVISNFPSTFFSNIMLIVGVFYNFHYLSSSSTFLHSLGSNLKSLWSEDILRMPSPRVCRAASGPALDCAAGALALRGAAVGAGPCGPRSAGFCLAQSSFWLLGGLLSGFPTSYGRGVSLLLKKTFSTMFNAFAMR